MSVERPLPKLSKTKAASIIVGFVLIAWSSLVLAAQVGSMMPFWLLGLALVAIVSWLYHRRRCPQCGSRMMFRAEPLTTQSYSKRILFDCKHCDIVWDSGEIQDESLG
jgi:hypothetical protein